MQEGNGSAAGAQDRVYGKKRCHLTAISELLSDNRLFTVWLPTGKEAVV
jgi:hypothetical protein